MYMAYTICIVGFGKARCECLEKDFVLLLKTGQDGGDTVRQFPHNVCVSYAADDEYCLRKQMSGGFSFIYLFPAASKLFINFSRILPPPSLKIYTFHR